MAAMVAILDFRLERFYIFLIYKSLQRFLTSFKSIGLFVQEEKWKIDFQNGRHGGHLGFSIGLILAIFDLQFTAMRPTKFQVNWPFSSGESKNKWRPSWISDWNDFSYFWSSNHPDAPYQVSVRLAFRFRRRNEIQIFKMAARPSLIFDRKDFSYFWSTSHPDAFYQVWSQLAIRFRRRSEK